MIEDQLMRIGENAHEFGFIVLDTEAMEELFVSGHGNGAISVADALEGRIKGHVVPQHLLANVTDESVTMSLRAAQKNAKEQIVKLRDPEGHHDFKSGRKHGFWVQQFTNTTMAID